MVTACVGGLDPRREAQALAAGVHVVVGTPGRLVDHLSRQVLDLSALGVLVLDEADEMLDMGFREELEAILEAAPPERRTILFSATLPKPIVELARAYTREPVRVTATPPRQAHEDITYRAHVVAQRERDHAIVNVLRALEPASALVFRARREAVTHTAASLGERGFETVAISGELTQAERLRALKSLRDGRARVLVATDVAARGLDLPGIELVLHADLPQDASALQHRSGRTGRAGKKGLAVLLASPPERYKLERMLREAGVTPEWAPVPTAEPDPAPGRGAAGGRGRRARSPRRPRRSWRRRARCWPAAIRWRWRWRCCAGPGRRCRPPRSCPETARAASEAPARAAPGAPRTAGRGRLVPHLHRPGEEGRPEVDPAAALPARRRHPRRDRQDRRSSPPRPASRWPRGPPPASPRRRGSRIRAPPASASSRPGRPARCWRGAHRPDSAVPGSPVRGSDRPGIPTVAGDARPTAAHPSASRPPADRPRIAGRPRPATPGPAARSRVP